MRVDITFSTWVTRSLFQKKNTQKGMMAWHPSAISPIFPFPSLVSHPSCSSSSRVFSSLGPCGDVGVDRALNGVGGSVGVEGVREMISIEKLGNITTLPRVERGEVPSFVIKARASSVSPDPLASVSVMLPAPS